MRKTVWLLVCLGFYYLYGKTVVWLSGEKWQIIFVWNVFLALLPLLFVRALEVTLKKEQKSRLLIGLFALLWLFFFPNAPYLITDLTHIASSGLVDPNNYYTFLYWFKLLYLGSGVVFGVLLGFGSLRTMHTLVSGWKGRLFGWFFVAAVSLLGGLAMYIGRMLRFNSWDILRPFHLLRELGGALSRSTVSLALLYSFFIFGTYFVFHLVTTSSSPANPEASQ